MYLNAKKYFKPIYCNKPHAVSQLTGEYNIKIFIYKFLTYLNRYLKLKTPFIVFESN